MKGFVVLETGEVFEGLWKGGQERAGEIVFNTSHSGYEEIATDPSYFSQIVVMTAPMMGNYGVDRRFWESRNFWIRGFVCLQVQETPRDRSWIDQLVEHEIPLISEVDTRKLTLRLRTGGTPWGALVQAENQEQALQKAKDLIRGGKDLDPDWVYLVSRKDRQIREGLDPRGPRIGVIDFGSKENILRELASRCRELVIFNSRVTLEEIKKERLEGILLTNGPGNPEDVKIAPLLVRQLIGQMPLFGICMGHQILALALGAKTYKLKFGHRGSNHPIKDDLLRQIYMTSQNHGYAVDAQTLPQDALITQRNLNDMTVAGFYSQSRNYLGIQYHPESRPGPHEAAKLFDFFVNRMILGKKE